MTIHAANLRALLSGTPALTLQEREWIEAAAGALDLEFRIARLDLRKGDILVAKFSAPVSAEMATRVGDNFKKIAPGLRLLILDGKTELSVLTSAEIEARL
jgi:hypothetical protein